VTPSTFSLAILAGLQRKAPLFQGVTRTVRAPRAVRRRLAHRNAVAARSATVHRKEMTS
jgi:hypothetical protein